MKLVLALLVVLVSAVVLGQDVPISDQYVYADAIEGIEAINFLVPNLAYISNLKIVATGQSTLRVWFQADKSLPNLFYAEVNPEGTPRFMLRALIPGVPFSRPEEGFYSNGQSPIAAGRASPFIDFDVRDNRFVGPALSSSLSYALGLKTYSDVLQSAHISGDLKTTTLNQSMFTSYDFSGVMVDIKPGDGKISAYFAGFADDNRPNVGFTIARGSVDPTTNKITLDESDIVGSENFKELSNCYDLYDQAFHPRIWGSSTLGYIIVAVPGRCGYFARVNISDPAKPLSTEGIKLLDPVNEEHEYVVSFDFNPVTQRLWYITKPWNSPQLQINSLQVDTWINRGNLTSGLKWPEADPVIVVGQDSIQGELVFLMGRGLGQIQMFTTTATMPKLTLSGTAHLPGGFELTSNGVYTDPYLYFGTYSPNAYLARVTKLNFCEDNGCGDNAYCVNGECVCVIGYAIKHIMSKDSQGHPVEKRACFPSHLVIDENMVKQESGLIATFAVLFAFGAVVAIMGWTLWYRAKKQYVAMS